MRRGGGKAKGSEFERAICKRLSLWVSDGLHTDLFWRSAMSGGRSTVARKKGVDVRQAGDICAVAPEGHVLTNRFYIECKHYRDLSLPGLLLCNRGTLYDFWIDTIEQSGARKKEPMLIAKQNLFPTMVLLPRLRLGPQGWVLGYDNKTIHFVLWRFDDLVSHPFSSFRLDCVVG